MGAAELRAMYRRVSGKVGRMSFEDCERWFERFSAEGTTALNHDTIKELTGGFCTQTICAVVKGKVRDRRRRLQRGGRA